MMFISGVWVAHNYSRTTIVFFTNLLIYRDLYNYSRVKLAPRKELGPSNLPLPTKASAGWLPDAVIPRNFRQCMDSFALSHSRLVQT